MLRIKDVIKEKETTLKEVAEKMGITQPSLSSLINGNPTAEKLEQIAAALQVSVTELFEPPMNDSITCPTCKTVLQFSKKG